MKNLTLEFQNLTDLETIEDFKKKVNIKFTTDKNGYPLIQYLLVDNKWELLAIHQDAVSVTKDSYRYYFNANNNIHWRAKNVINPKEDL